MPLRGVQKGKVLYLMEVAHKKDKLVIMVMMPRTLSHGKLFDWLSLLGVVVPSLSEHHLLL
jgi:hypothetical protein